MSLWSVCVGWRGRGSTACFDVPVVCVYVCVCWGGGGTACFDVPVVCVCGEGGGGGHSIL